jgi:hypothetical protein
MTVLNTLKRGLIALIVTIVAVSPLYASVPDTVNFSGTMSNEFGAIEGSKTVTTTLVAEDETTAIWTHEHDAVEFTDGRFSLQLTPSDVSNATYLKIEIEGENGFILFDLTSSFFALSAKHALTADTASSVEWANVSGKPSGLDSIEDTTTTNATKLQEFDISTTAPSAGQVLKWNGTAWAPAADNFEADTNTDTDTITTNATQLHHRTISSDTPEVGHILKWNGSEWAPAGDVGGDYTLTKATDTTLGGVKIADSSRIDIDENGFISVDISGIDTDTDTTTTNATLLQQNPLNAASPSSGQILKWNGSEWALAPDDVGEAFNPSALTDDLIPETTNEIDLGSTTKKFQSAYFQGNTYMNSVVMNSSSLEADSEFYSFPSGDTPYHIVMTDIANPTLNIINNLNLQPNNFIITNGAGDIVESIITPIAQTLLEDTTTENMLTTLIGESTTGHVLKWDGSSWRPSASSSAISDDSIETSHIQDSAITSAKIANGAVTETDIASGAITASKIGSNAVTAGAISNAAITNSHIHGSAAIDFSKLNISKSDIENLGIPGEDTTYTPSTGLQLDGYAFAIDATVVTKDFNGTITANAFVGDGSGLSGIVASIENDSVTSEHIEDGTIETNDIKNSAISTEKLLAGAVTSGKLASNAVNSGKILNGTITRHDISDSAAIEFSKLNITKSDIEGLGIPGEDTTYTPSTGLQLNGYAFAIDATVVTKDFSGTITANAFVGDGSGIFGIGASNINDSSITSSHISDGAITNSDISNSADIDFSKLNITKSDIEGLGIPSEAGTGLSLDGTVMSIDAFVVTNNYNGVIAATAFFGDGSNLSGVSTPTTWSSFTTTISGISTSVHYSRYKVIDGNTASLSMRFTADSNSSDFITFTVPIAPDNITSLSVVSEDSGNYDVKPAVNLSGDSTFTILNLNTFTEYEFIVTGVYEY